MKSSGTHKELSMNIEEMRKFVEETIRYKNYEFLVKEKNQVPFLQIQFIAPDNITGKTERQYCRKWQLSEFMTKTEIVRTAFLAVVQAERHEIEENFKYCGVDIFNSHIGVDFLRDSIEEKALQIERGEDTNKKYLFDIRD